MLKNLKIILIVSVISIVCCVQTSDAVEWDRDSTTNTLEPNTPNDNVDIGNGNLDANDVFVGDLLVTQYISGTITERLGNELVTKGNFDSNDSWNEGQDWSIVSAIASYAPVDEQEYGDLYQVIAIESGKKYRVKFSITAWSGDYITDPSTLEVKLGNTTVANLTEGDTGNYSYDVTSTGGNDIRFAAYSGYDWGEAVDITMDDVSVMEIISEDTVRNVYLDPSLFVENDLDVGGDVNIVGDLQVDGSDIGITADTDLIRLASNTVTVNGTLAATTVTGANVTSGSNPGHTHTAYINKDGSIAFTGTGAGFKDEDDMVSDSNSAAVSQQSIKAYQDNVVGHDGEAYRYIDVNDTKTKVYTKYFTGTTDNDTQTTVAHGCTAANIVHVSAIVYDSSDSVYRTAGILEGLDNSKRCKVSFGSSNIILDEVGSNLQGQVYRIRVDYH